MKVPVRRNPQTNAVAVEQPYARAASSIDYSGITGAIKNFASDLNEERKSLRKFDLQNRLLEETNALSQDYSVREKEAPLGAANFTPKVLQDYEDRHTKLLDTLWAEGYQEDELAEFSTRLHALRNTFGERALGFESKSIQGLAVKEGDRLVTNLSQYVGNNPLDGYESAVSEAVDFWEKYPGIDAMTREDRANNARMQLRQTGGRAAALRTPEFVIKKLDPAGVTAPKIAAEPEETVTLSGSGYYGGTSWRVTDTPGSPRPKGRKHAGWDLAGMKVGTPFHAPLAGEVIAVKPNNGNAGNMITVRYADGKTNTFMHLDTISVQKGQMVAAGDQLGTAGNTGNASTRGTDRAVLHVEGTAGLLEGGQVVRQPKPVEPEPEVAPEFDPTQIQTGIALFDDMTGEERLQVLAWARQKMDQQEVSKKAEFDVLHGNLVAAAGSGQPTPPVPPLEEYVRVYGDLNGPRKYAEATSAVATAGFIDKSKTQSATEIEAGLEAMRPTDPLAVDYQQKLAAYNSAVEAAGKMQKLRQDDPAGYVLNAFPQVAQQLQAANTPEARKAAYAGMTAAFDKLGIPAGQRKPLTAEGAKAVMDQYESAPPAQRIALLNQWSSEMGSLWRPFIAQIAETGAPMTFVMHWTLRDLPGRDALLTNIMAGQDIIRQDPARKPTAEMANASYRAGMKTALQYFNPQFSAAVNDAAAALYVKNGGKTVTGTKLDPADQALYLDSLRQVLGGKPGDPNTGIVQINKAWTVLPPGVNKQRFENWQEGLTFAQLQRANPRKAIPFTGNLRPVNIQDIVDYGQFVMASPGQYWIKLSTDGGFIMEGNGQNYVVNLDAATIGGR